MTGAAAPVVAVLNMNPRAATRGGARSIVRVLSQLAPQGVRVVERHVQRLSPARLDALAPAAVVLGPQGVPFDAYAPLQLAHLLALVRHAAAGWPTLGICGGHQALVLAYAGTLAPVHGGVARGTYAGLHKETGIREVTLDRADPLVGALPAVGRFHVSHVEGVSDLPADFALVGWGAPCRVQAVRLRDRRAWGVQVHPERGGDGPALLRRFLQIAGLLPA